MAEVDLNELERYLRIFQENPDSRVFAPLADLYRRLGKLEEAEEICREGIRRHPYYAGGRVALAHILLDRGRLPEALQETDSVVTYYPDNLLARKILIRVLGGLNELDRARREFEALRHLAPMVANDPEVERALQGSSHSPHFPASPLASGQSLAPGMPAEISVPGLAQAEKATLVMPEWTQHQSQDLAPAVARSRRLAVLLRKKLVLESLIHTLA